MLVLVIAAIAALILGFLLYKWGDDNYSTFDWLFMIVGGLLVTVGGIALVCIIYFSISWHGSAIKAKLINREYGTSYTQEEVFYASSVINTIRELDRKRVEVNGDVFRDKDQKSE